MELIQRHPRSSSSIVEKQKLIELTFLKRLLNPLNFYQERYKQKKKKKNPKDYE